MLLAPGPGPRAPGPWTLCQQSDDVRAELSPELAARVGIETHASALELTTGVHRTVAGAAAELGALRAALAGELARLGLAAASAGLHPSTTWRETVSSKVGQPPFVPCEREQR